MYKRILVATDGSKLSSKAVKHAVGLARVTGAHLYVFHGRPPYPTPYFGETLAVPASAVKAYEAKTRAVARQVLDEAADFARRAGIEFTGLEKESFAPADDIGEIARKHKCELVVMASHGRRGLKRLLVGSETNAVITHSKVPVLVVR